MSKHWYPVLLFAVIFSMPLGSYFLAVDLGVINVYAFRVVLAIALLILIWKRDLITSTGPLSRNFFHLMLFWMGYGMLSMLWSINLKEGLKDLFYLGTGLVIYLVVISLLKKAKNSFKVFGYAWICGFVVINMIALYEIRTGKHFSIPFLEKLNSLAMNHPVNFTPVATFDNPNNYATYLILSLPIVTFLLKDRVKWSVVVWPIAYYFVYCTQSRLGMLAFWILLVGWIALSYFNPHIKSYLFSLKKTAAGIVLIASVMATITLSNEFQLSDTFGRLGNAPPTNLEPPEFSSVNVRKGMLINGMHYLKDSYGMGVGAGQFRAYMLDGRAVYPTNTIINPHNWIIEIVSQYGLLVFVLAVLWLGKVLVVFWRHRSFHRHSFYIVEYGLLTIVGYFLVSNASSSFMGMSINWVVLALLAYFADKLVTGELELSMTSHTATDEDLPPDNGTPG